MKKTESWNAYVFLHFKNFAMALTDSYMDTEAESFQKCPIWNITKIEI